MARESRMVIYEFDGKTTNAGRDPKDRPNVCFFYLKSDLFWRSSCSCSSRKRIIVLDEFSGYIEFVIKC